MEEMHKTGALQAEVIALRERVAALEKLLFAVLPAGAGAAAQPSAAPTTQARAAAAGAVPSDAAAADRRETASSAPAPAAPTADDGSAAVAGVAAPQPLPQATPSTALMQVTVAMAATRVVMHQLVLPADINQLGICTGGQVLSWIDLCAGLSAKTLAQGPCVTASVDAVHFLRPCRLGGVVIIAAMVARTFNTSMEVAVVVESEDMRTGVRHHCCSAHLTFVVRPQLPTAAGGAVGAAAGGAAAPGLPRVVPTSSEHRAVWEGAEVRRQQRLERRARARQDPALRDMERVCRLQPITHREGGPTLPPAVTLHTALSHHNSSRHLNIQPQQPQQQPQPQQPKSQPSSRPLSRLLSRASSATQQAGAALSPHPSLQPSLQQLQEQLGSFMQQPPHAAAGDEERQGQRQQQDGGANQRQGQETDGGSPNLLSPAPSSGSGLGDVDGTGAADAGGGPRAVPRAGSPPTLLVPPLYAPPPRRQRVPPGCTTAYMTQSILPQHANTLHITFGGQVMSWIEQCAYISASRLRAPSLLTAAVDSLVFVRPTRVGDILYISAQVSAIFGSSLEVMVSVFGESPYAGAGSSAHVNGGGADDAGGGGGGIFHCADAFVTVVAVDERHGTPVTVPFELDPREQADVLRYQGALARRAERLALRGQFAAAETTRVSLDGGHTYSPPPETSVEGGPSVLDAIPPL
ncbi:hypothetical protein CHLRE_03g148450v5 [Chlamydomonas reinhardtii]|uniref:HotDog ACOT-type domain-containing protein n=1 Tax=Chlamydomonas reinhardtii TaxID=3055 RepID=A0A2K3DVI7_CHLRE|nr:uncharacterized protein CHLRE_03g148450v5 [Chlamydomonas reinhardtii]PNW84553.1 hypothetical protein CHLRE_03g148450v5 [Chlamydomonas reinhardtii]